jgi:hypothetical protein
MLFLPRDGGGGGEGRGALCSATNQFRRTPDQARISSGTCQIERNYSIPEVEAWKENTEERNPRSYLLIVGISCIRPSPGSLLKDSHLKVDRNEKFGGGGGSGRCLLLRISTGLWRSRFIFHMNRLFLCGKIRRIRMFLGLLDPDPSITKQK